MWDPFYRYEYERNRMNWDPWFRYWKEQERLTWDPEYRYLKEQERLQWDPFFRYMKEIEKKHWDPDYHWKEDRYGSSYENESYETRRELTEEEKGVWSYLDQYLYIINYMIVDLAFG